MNPAIQEILRLAGEMPDPEAHRRYLETLPPGSLNARLATLRAEVGRPRATDWTNARNQHHFDRRHNLAPT